MVPAAVQPEARSEQSAYEFRWVLFHNNAPYHSKRNLRLMCDTIHGKLSREQHEQLYEWHVAQGTAISAQNATTYTCPLYASLISLLVGAGGELVRQRLLLLLRLLRLALVTIMMMPRTSLLQRLHSPLSVFSFLSRRYA